MSHACVKWDILRIVFSSVVRGILMGMHTVPCCASPSHAVTNVAPSDDGFYRAHLVLSSAKSKYGDSPLEHSKYLKSKPQASFASSALSLIHAFASSTFSYTANNSASLMTSSWMCQSCALFSFVGFPDLGSTVFAT